jgi:hypothetical protein
LILRGKKRAKAEVAPPLYARQENERRERYEREKKEERGKGKTKKSINF